MKTVRGTEEMNLIDQIQGIDDWSHKIIVSRVFGEFNLSQNVLNDELPTLRFIIFLQISAENI